MDRSNQFLFLHETPDHVLLPTGAEKYVFFIYQILRWSEKNFQFMRSEVCLILRNKYISTTVYSPLVDYIYKMRTVFLISQE